MKEKICMLCVIFSFVFTSCSDSDDNNEIASGNILISTMIPNKDGVSGNAFMQLIDNVEKASYNNQKALQASYSVAPIVIGNEIFLLPGWSNKTGKLEKYSFDNNILVKKGEYELDSNSGAVNCVAYKDKLYVSYNYLGKIVIIDKDKLTKIKEIDLSKYGVGDNNPDPAIMVERDGLLYVGLCQLVGGYAPDPKRQAVDILIVDLNSDTVLKMITQSTSGMSMPTKPESDENSIFIDENNDIYINCISGFGMLGQKAGFLRIKDGETEFDADYIFDVTNTSIKNEEFKGSAVNFGY
jgi:hypothetical protein